MLNYIGDLLMNYTPYSMGNFKPYPLGYPLYRVGTNALVFIVHLRLVCMIRMVIQLRGEA